MELAMFRVKQMSIVPRENWVSKWCNKKNLGKPELLGSQVVQVEKLLLIF
jgi:hypothetical protein